MSRLRFVCVVALLCGGLLVALSVAAGPTYDLAVDDAVSTPEETVEIEGSTFEIDGVGVVSPGDSISMTVESPEDYRIFLYNQDEENEFNAGWDADETHITIGTADDDLDTADLDPGTYLLSLEPRGEGRQAVYPLVVAGYELSLDVPHEVEESEELELTATVEKTALEEDPAEVMVALWDGDDVTDVSLAHDGAGEYSTVLERDSLDPGTYSVYGGIPDEDANNGYQTALAVTDGGELSVVEGADDSDDDDDADDPGESDDSDDTDDSDDADDSDDTDDSDDADDTDDPEETDDADSADDTDDTDDADATDDADDTGTEPDSDEDDAGNDHETDNSDDERETIAPNESQESTDTPADDTLGIPAATIIGALIILTLVARLRGRLD